MSNNKVWAPEKDVKNEIQEFKGNLDKYKSAKITDEEFAQFRLERGVYGQKQGGVQMFRIKIPYGALSPEQLEKIADVSSVHGHGISHLTTRQAIQLHFVKLKEIPILMDKLAEADLTTREACGNTVRNVTACPYAGICKHEAFDVTAHAHGSAKYLMRNPNTTGLGRKFKISFSGCEDSCGLAAIHDLGFIAKTRTNGSVQKGFKVLVGGGLGASPRAAEVLFDFLPENQIFTLSEALARVFFKYGERNKRHMARIKFLLKDIGIEKLRELIELELRGLDQEKPEILKYSRDVLGDYPKQNNEDKIKFDGDEDWFRTNVKPQRQNGYSAVLIRLILGDIDAPRLKKLAKVVKKYSPEVRITLDQNFLIRWVENKNISNLYKDLKELDLVLSHAEKVGDLTACPGNDTCNLGIASSKGLGEELSYQLENQLNGYKDLNLKIKMSGCPNSCGQHHIADIGFWGGSLKVDGKVAPAFQMMLGGYTKGEILETAKPVIKLPARAIPRALEEVLKFTRDNKKESESFNEFVSRVGLKAFKEFLRPFAKAKPEDFDRFYSDFGVKEDFYVRSGMKGECAGVEGDLVSSILEKSRSFLDTAKENLDDEDYSSASYLAFTSIVQAAKGVALNNDLNLNTYNKILENFAESIDQAENWRNDLAEFRSQLEIFKGQIPNKIGTENYLNFALKAFYCAKDLISKTQTSVEERI